MTWAAVRGMLARLRLGPGRRGAGAMSPSIDDAYERKLELMERRLGELGAYADVLQRSEADEGDWHPEPQPGRPGPAQA